MDSALVERLHQEFRTLAELLEKASEPSLRSTADDCFRKSLLLSAASGFERAVTATILDFVAKTSANNRRVLSFVERKGLSRQYHTLFDWDRSNANKFFSLFGDEFKKVMEARLQADSDLEDSVKAFMEVGSDRNRLVHEDFGAFVLEKTTDEIFDLYRKAERFVTALPELLNGDPVASNQPGQ